MDKVVVTRIEHSDEGVFGVMTINDKICGFTLENPSTLIPTGNYKAKRDYTGIHQWFEILDVPGRTNIEFHVGNRPSHSRGCILVGSQIGYLGEDRCVLRSLNAMNLMLNMLVEPEKGFDLWIRR